MRRAITTFALLGACTSSSNATSDAAETVNCATETRADTFVVGLPKPGAAGVLDFKLMQATPAPPASGNNAWQVQINTTAGAGLTGATIKTTPYMPDHMHTSPLKPVTTEMGNGLYEITPVNLWMPGLWETTIQVASPSGTDSVVYSFCIPN